MISTTQTGALLARKISIHHLQYLVSNEDLVGLTNCPLR